MYTHQESYDFGHNYGVSIYPKISSSDAALIAFGMTNVTLIQQAERDNALMMPDVVKSEFFRGFTVGLMTAAKHQGKMIA
jgi:hypothetical protein